MECTGKNSVFIAVAVVFLVVQPVHGFQSWFLDVGQGDGVSFCGRGMRQFFRTVAAARIKIGKNVLEPFLKSQGIRTLDWILVSHADADHNERDRVAFEGGGRYPGAESGTSGGGKRAGGI